MGPTDLPPQGTESCHHLERTVRGPALQTQERHRLLTILDLSTVRPVYSRSGPSDL